MPVQAGPTGVTSPPDPTALNGTLQLGPQVRLTWRDNAINESGFVVERATGTGGFVPIATPWARNSTGNTVYTDTPVPAGVTLQYRVKAVNASGSSGYSNVFTVTVPNPPAAPSNLSATAVRGPGNNDTVTLSWTDNSTDETRFTIQRSTTPDFATVTTATASAGATTWTQTTVRNRTFYYRIGAENLGGGSAWSNTASVTTP